MISPRNGIGAGGAFSYNAVAVGLTLVLGLWGTYTAWDYVREDAQTEAGARFEFRVRQITDTIRGRLADHEELLRGGAGLFAASGFVERQGWRTYMASLNLEQRYPGIQGVGFSLRIPAGEREAHERRMRADGFPKYAIRPAGGRPEYTAIIYMEPFKGRNTGVLGYDMYTEPARRAAMDLARDTGNVAVTAKLRLVQDNPTGVQTGFVMYLPVYRNAVAVNVPEERRRALIGYIHSPFLMDDFMLHIPFDPAGIRLEIYDGVSAIPDRLLYDSTAAMAQRVPETKPLFRRFEQMNIHGRTWILSASSLPAFDATQGIDRQRLVLASGIALSLALTAIVWLLSTLRSRALALAQAMTSQLRASEVRSRLLASLVEQSSDAMFSHDLSGIVTSWNEAATDLFGFSAADAIGKSVRVLHLAGASDAEWERVRQRFSSRQPENYEAMRRGKDGAPLDLLVTTSPQYDDDGNHVGKIISMRDITRRKQTEDALRESRLQLALALQGSSLALFDWDVTTGRVRLSELWNVILGGPAQPTVTMIGAVEKRVHPEDLPVLQGKLYEALRGEIPSYHVEHRVRTHGGEWKWIASTAKVTARDSAGRALRVTGTNADISARKRAEAALRESEERFQLAVSGSAAGIWDWNLVSGEYYVSPHYEALLGFGRGEWKYSRKAFAERLHPEDRARVLAAIERHLGQREPYNEEYRMRRKNGAYGWFHSRGQALWDEAGRPKRFSGSIDDISVRKEAENMKNDFIATVNHELRTPLTSVIGALDLLKLETAGRLEGEAAMFLGMAQKNSERLAALVNDILDIEKLESGLMEFQREPVELTSFLEESLALNRPYAQQFDVELRLEPPPRAKVMADEQRLMQVITNLMSNAIKYSPRGGTVTVRAAARGRGYRISVEDHGPGIPDEFRSRIFGKFAQADSTDSRLKSGTGVGLAISKAMVEKMGGRIGFDSVAGEGATFYFDLPRA